MNIHQEEKMPNSSTHISDDNDPVYRLALVAKDWSSLNKESQLEHIIAAMGAPTYPIYERTVKTAIIYWNNILQNIDETEAARTRLARNHLDLKARDEIIDVLAKKRVVIPYGDPKGSESARKKAADALNRWLFAEEAMFNRDEKITQTKAQRHYLDKDELLFVQGGAAAISFFIDSLVDGYIMTPQPYYTLYKKNKPIHPIDVTDQGSLRLSAAAIKKSFDIAKIKGINIAGIIICDPNNPLGTVISQSEAEEIVKVLEEEFINSKNIGKKFPQIFIDEAYAEMCGKRQSNLIRALLKSEVLSPFTSGMRLATKSLSAAGARLGVFYSKNTALLNKMLHRSIKTYGHVAEPCPETYASALEAINSSHLAELYGYYAPQVQLAYNRLEAMGASVSNYQLPEAAFYVMADFSDLLGTPIVKSALPVLQKEMGTLCQSDEDITYHLLFSKNISIAPLSYFGWPYQNSNQAYFRITCSLGQQKLNDLLNRVRDDVTEARQTKLNLLTKQVDELLKQNEHYIVNAYKLSLRAKNLQQKELCDETKESLRNEIAIDFNYKSQDITDEIVETRFLDNKAKQLKQLISAYKELLTQIKNANYYNESNEIDEKYINAAKKIQQAYKVNRSRQSFWYFTKENFSTLVWNTTIDILSESSRDDLPKPFIKSLHQVKTKEERHFYIKNCKIVAETYLKVRDNLLKNSAQISTKQNCTEDQEIAESSAQTCTLK